MPNTSASGGYLTPTSNPIDDDALVNFIQAWVVGITGLSGANVRPRWQPEPANIPDVNVTWAAIGISSREADPFIYENHLPSANGSLGETEVRRHESLTFLASFYGPSANFYATVFRDGMQVSQNHDVLSVASFGFIESEDLVAVPELLKEKWLFRVDLRFKIKRQVVRRYGIQNLIAAGVQLNNEKYITQIIV